MLGTTPKFHILSCYSVLSRKVHQRLGQRIGGGRVTKIFLKIIQTFPFDLCLTGESIQQSYYIFSFSISFRQGLQFVGGGRMSFL